MKFLFIHIYGQGITVKHFKSGHNEDADFDRLHNHFDASTEAEITGQKAAPQAECDNRFIKIPAVIKWYNPIKGYGFATATDRKDRSFGDIFVHASDLRAIGRDNIAPKQTILVSGYLDANKKPGQNAIADALQLVGDVLEVSLPDLQQVHEIRKIPAQIPETELLCGIYPVKWYSPDKGYGFIDLGGRRDALLHAEILHTAGMRSVQTGMDVYVEIWTGAPKKNGGNGCAVIEIALPENAPQTATRSASVVPGQGGIKASHRQP